MAGGATTCGASTSLAATACYQLARDQSGVSALPRNIVCRRGIKTRRPFTLQLHLWRLAASLHSGVRSLTLVSYSVQILPLPPLLPRALHRTAVCWGRPGRGLFNLPKHPASLRRGSNTGENHAVEDDR